MELSVIIAAAGSACRMAATGNKVLLPLAGRPVLAWSLAIMQNEAAVREIVIAARERDMRQIRLLAAAFPKVKAVVEGGAGRADSVRRALLACAESCTHIAVHDAARPLLTAADLARLLAVGEEAEGGAILAAPLTDSVRGRGENDSLGQMLDREGLLLAQTPQLFPAEILRRAYALPGAEQATDEARLVAELGLPIRYVLSQDANFKLTVAEDIPAAEAVLLARLGKTGEKAPPRYGLGWDSHQLAAGRPLILGGVRIPHDKGLLAHSDGDVLLHAVIDALLGAAALPDIGRQFPDTDPAYQDISSLILLERAAELVREQGLRIIDIDGVILAQQPKLAPYMDAMREKIAATLGLSIDAVSVKAKTGEELGSIGGEKVMAALAIAALQR